MARGIRAHGAAAFAVSRRVTTFKLRLHSRTGNQPGRSNALYLFMRKNLAPVIRVSTSDITPLPTSLTCHLQASRAHHRQITIGYSTRNVL